jgi:hypothetical protein
VDDNPSWVAYILNIIIISSSSIITIITIITIRIVPKRPTNTNKHLLQFHSCGADEGEG